MKDNSRNLKNSNGDGESDVEWDAAWECILTCVQEENFKICLQLPTYCTPQYLSSWSLLSFSNPNVLRYNYLLVFLDSLFFSLVEALNFHYSFTKVSTTYKQTVRQYCMCTWYRPHMTQQCIILLHIAVLWVVFAFEVFPFSCNWKFNPPSAQSTVCFRVFWNKVLIKLVSKKWIIIQNVIIPM